MAEPLLENPFRWGPFQASPFATYRFTYGNGLNAQPGQQETTALHQISPGLALQSKFLTLNYSPTLSYYSSHAFEDTVDHSASGTLRVGYGDWLFSLSHAFAKTTQPLVETGAQTPQQDNSTTFSSHFQTSEKTSFDFTLSQQLQEAEALNSSRTWSSINWANYQLSEKTLIGIGAGIGYTDVQLSSDSRYEQVQARIGWRPGLKLSLDLNGGIEIRHFVNGATDDQVNPLFGASLNYSLFESTTFSLSANRATGTSVLTGETTDNSSVAAGLQQRFFGKLNLVLFGSFGTIEYQTGSGLQNNELLRADETQAFSADLGFAISRKGEGSIFYQFSRNSSTRDGFGFHSDQYGFHLGYRF